MMLSSDAWMWFSVRRKCCTRLRLCLQCQQLDLSATRMRTGAYRRMSSRYCLFSLFAFFSSVSSRIAISCKPDPSSQQQQKQQSPAHGRVINNTAHTNANALNSRSNRARTEPHIRGVSASGRYVLELQLQFVQPALLLG